MKTIREAYESGFAARIDALDASDPEKAHGLADRILLDVLAELGCEAVVDAYDRLVNRSDWWAAA